MHVFIAFESLIYQGPFFTMHVMIYKDYFYSARSHSTILIDLLGTVFYSACSHTTRVLDLLGQFLQCMYK